MQNFTTRRGFLGAAAVASVAATLEPASAVVEPEPWGIKLGVATYTFRSFSREKTIEMLKAVRAPWISIKDTEQQLSIKGTPEQTAAARKEFDDAGFKVMSAGNIDMAKAKTLDDLRPIFDWAKAARLPMMVCAPTHDNIKFVETLVKQYDIRIAIHNHGPEDHNFPTVQSVLDVVRSLDPRCGLCMDCGHTMRTGVNVVEQISNAGARLFDMHVKDLASATDKASQCDVGDGIMPFPAIFKTLKKMNYQGCVNLEYEINEKDPLPGVLRSFSYMRGVLAGLAG
ncbi:MAG TPA: sugar phosphate isomerase/epimerase [Verrucomicrobiae bacterium]|nr:sugar phosphate isomerase/epimerase [Verrucomicrobiae bacterium]